MNTDNSKHLARALLDVCSGSIDEIGPQEAVAALYSCMSFVVAQAPKEHDATIRESLKSAVQEIADLAAEAREIYAAAPMTSQQIGDVACDVTKKLEEPFAVALCFHEWAPASNDSDFVGIVAFNHPHDWSPTADEREEVDDCCEDVAQQIYEGKLQGGQGFVLWGEPMTPATKEITRQITRTQKTLAAWCRGKFFVPLIFAYATHDANGTMQ